MRRLGFCFHSRWLWPLLRWRGNKVTEPSVWSFVRSTRATHAKCHKAKSAPEPTGARQSNYAFERTVIRHTTVAAASCGRSMRALGEDKTHTATFGTLGGFMPTQIILATRLMWASLGLVIINSAIQWGYLTSQATPVFLVTVQAATLAIVAWLIYKIGRGRNWARVTFAIMFVLGLLPALPMMAATFNRSLVAGCLTVVSTICQFVALYLIFTAPGRSWFSPAPKPT